MTPDELARYRAFAEPGTNEWVLLDVVEAAWAERDRAHILCSGGVCLECAHMRARADLAAAALARVREYADEIDGGILAPVAREIRAAIEGDDQ